MKKLFQVLLAGWGANKIAADVVDVSAPLLFSLSYFGC